MLNSVTDPQVILRSPLSSAAPNSGVEPSLVSSPVLYYSVPRRDLSAGEHIINGLLENWPRIPNTLQWQISQFEYTIVKFLPHLL